MNAPPTDRDVVLKARDVRLAQRAYYANRQDKQALRRAIGLERDLDELLERWTKANGESL